MKTKKKRNWLRVETRKLVIAMTRCAAFWPILYRVTKQNFAVGIVCCLQITDVVGSESVGIQVMSILTRNY